MGDATAAATAATAADPTAAAGGDESAAAGCCWVCLGPGGPGAPLALPCACPRPVHTRCLARWQLQQAGREEETTCRFCRGPYGDWRDALGAPEPGLEPAAPVMALSVRGRVHKLRVSPGPEGRRQFQSEVRRLLGRGGEGGGEGAGGEADAGPDVDVVFEIKVPATGERVQLSGFQAFDAAAHCAAISAARRAARRRQRAAAVAAADPPPPAAPPPGAADVQPAAGRGSGAALSPVLHVAAAPTTAGSWPQLVGPAAGATPRGRARRAIQWLPQLPALRRWWRAAAAATRPAPGQLVGGGQAAAPPPPSALPASMPRRPAPLRSVSDVSLSDCAVQLGLFAPRAPLSAHGGGGGSGGHGAGDEGAPCTAGGGAAAALVRRVPPAVSG
ncbi:hypothetical protein Rsub_08102 [Raphidocelis subcapitata]|uniref:RING-CH-type domain-containing protein n=1 Tax=Raphidocelis subcapitata TaxID=307507 RepID=A0A2V0P8T8_9CHLO|nr:hypothetical protein Rsub_08102 [Raphidocelis subcapitata]|eukprot:GBF95979.1 hypothetical protein Rsub_08102 [Raphidocelis subcapitata]